MISIRELLGDPSGLLVLGITGRQARMETGWMLESGTHVSAGVTPGRGGQDVHGVPVFDTVRAAVDRHGCRVAMNYAPPAAAADSAIEAFQAGIELVVMSAENVPLHRLALALEAARRAGGRLIGPNSQGIVVPGVGRVGCPGGRDPQERFRPGSVAVVSRSGGMTSELAMLIGEWGWGTSVHLALGGSPIVGTTLTEGLKIVQDDPHTRAAVVFGEPSGDQEAALADAIEAGEITVPVAALIAGRAADSLSSDLPFGHAPRAGTGAERTVQHKLGRLGDAGVAVAMNTRDVRQALSNWNLASSDAAEPLQARNERDEFRGNHT